MKKLIVIILVSIFSFSTVHAGGVEDFERFLKQKETVQPPVKKVNDGNFDWLWEFLGTKKDKLKDKSRQKRQEYLNRANETLKQLQK